MYLPFGIEITLHIFFYMSSRMRVLKLLRIIILDYIDHDELYPTCIVYFTVGNRELISFLLSLSAKGQILFTN